MNELETKLKRPLDKSMLGGDVAGLRDLVGMLNNNAITGAVLPDQNELPAPATLPPSPAVELTIAPPAPVKQDNTRQLFFTGRLKSGKDFLAKQAGCHIEGFANPLYDIANYFFNAGITATTGKDIPGVRQFLQQCGNWGRNEITAQYPLTTERANFIYLVRTLGELGILGTDSEVEWSKYGADKSLWVAACVRRVEKYLAENPAGRVAVTNCRYNNEFKALQDAGFTHFHCLCSPVTWSRRLAPMQTSDPVLKDLSEQLAAKLDANVIQQISRQKDGPKLHAVWTDESVPPPSKRLYTTDEFLAHLNG